MTYSYDNKIRDKLNPLIYGVVYYNSQGGYVVSNHSTNYRYNDGNSMIHFSNSFDISAVKPGYFYRSQNNGGNTRTQYTYSYKLMPRSNYYYSLYYV